uniref:C2H2-type domain-containing protein n=1 Tax=Elaeophora elaphi TaxID=1147741 RepID=A0A158Q7H3_9BILA
MIFADSRNTRKLRVREQVEEGNDGSPHGRIKDHDISTAGNEAAIESGDIGRKTRRKPFPGIQEDLRNQSGIGEACCEQSVRSNKRLKKSGLDSSSLLVQSDEVSKSQIMHQGKIVPDNYEDDAVDVVSSNDDPLTELDVESCVKKTSDGFENRQKDELGESFQQYILNQAQKSISPTRREIFVDDDIRYAYDGPSGSNTSSMLRLDRKPVPATAPLLTTERTHVRVAKRKHDEAGKHRERRLQERELLQRDGRGRNARANRYYYEEEKPVLDDVNDVMYAEIGLGDSDFIETNFEEEELIYAADDDLVAADAVEEGGSCDNAMGVERMRNQSIQETREQDGSVPKQEDMIEQINDGVESNDDEAPPELEPQSPALQKVVHRSSANKHDDATNFTDGVGEMQVICVQTPNGTEQFIQLAPGQTLDGKFSSLHDNTLFMSESDNVEANVRHDLRTVEFSFLDSKNICCGLCGEIVLYDLLLSSHIPQHHPEVLEEGVTAFEDVPYETWLREKLGEEKRRMENSLCSIYDDLPSNHHSSRIYRSVSTIRVNPNEMSLNQLITALRKKMFEKLGRAVPVTLVDKQHARCGICNAVVSLNRKFEVIHLVRHFNAWHPSVHQCAGKWKLKKPQPGLGKPLSIQDFAVIDTSLDRGANLQCIWCGMFMAAEALAMHFSEVHPEEVEVPKCNLCLQELVINARLLEKYSDEFDVSMPDEHRIRCGKYGTTHTSEARLHAAIEKRLKLCEEGKNVDDIEDDEMEEERGTSYVNSRMTFGRRSKPKRQFIMPALRQAAPVNSRYVEAVNECHWKCKMCNGDILAAVISAGAIRHFRTEHPHHLHNMQYELCKTRLERISDGCMEFINPQLIECLVCNMTYMLHRPFNMCRAIRHLRSKHPDLMPEFAPTADSGNNLQRKRLVRAQEHSEGIITDPATIATLKAQYGVDFKKVQALKGANGEPVYVLLDDGDEIDPETASQLAASVAAGDFDRAKPEIQHEKTSAAAATTTAVDSYDKNTIASRPTSEVSSLFYP